MHGDVQRRSLRGIARAHARQAAREDYAAEQEDYAAEQGGREAHRHAGRHLRPIQLGPSGRPIHNHQIAMAHPARGQARLIAAEFTDAAISGASTANRPGLKRARHRMKF
jgi:hypothetical protein